ncbi:cobalt-precorrin-5B (C(1))-methyltransferase CbiD [Argonema antarcticum]|uniref:cobalt-precorrin-5B (C(1))-methyltransferase CbiD n=1 Tax=Argonema antarcticum TaxID=2942763 RepID=UPI002010E4A9|nr:cobalt-precorrin-5B (C(1))-methyltransferase CbiD [Argonema antarcticum]MCL1469498.1 cobalt-precorrin-5B (C(1))-methyltransferase CbiD [Argonema antarcticum A004/B2]
MRPRSGYTLPVFACAGAIAALLWLKHRKPTLSVSVDLIEPAQTVDIPIEQVSGIREGEALAITRSDPGDNLDLTRNTPIWSLVELSEGAGEQIIIKGGEGIGQIVDASGEAAIYAYARRLLRENLERLLEPGQKIEVTIALPEGRTLGLRTSNAAFGVVDGLSLLGTTGISQPLSAAGHLDASLEELRAKVREFSQFPMPNAQYPTLVFCVGENGLDLARQLTIAPERLLKTANWLGPMLVEAGLQGVKAILLFGYHGKLIKLAGGIFHTHHHLADGRLEILTAHCAGVGLPTPVLQRVLKSATAEDALKYLRELDAKSGSNWVNLVYGAIAQAIDKRSQGYIRTHSEREVCVGSVLFDRDRHIFITSQIGSALLSQLC